MRVIVAKYSGFCPGVTQAEEAILSTKRNARGKIYVLGHLIHNQTYIDYLTSQGVETVQDLSQIPLGSLVVIRTHGIDRRLEEKLRKAFTVLDLTCPKVKRVQRIIQSYAEKGYFVVITGKLEHPEVQGLVSYAEEHAVVEKEAQVPALLERLNNHPSPSILVISQTTGDRSLFDAVIQSLQEAGRERGWTVEVHDSICSITALREAEAVKNLEKVEATFVIGDKLSSNATKLYNTLKERSPQTFFIGTLEDLKNLQVDFSPLKAVQVVSSSSTPAFVEREIVSFLESL